MEGNGIDTGTGAPAIDPSNYNAPSIAVGQLVGTQTITRRVTAVTGGLYRATVSVPGMKAVVNPSILNLQAGQTKSFTVKLTLDTAPSNETTNGWLTWQGAGTSVRSPIVVVANLGDSSDRGQRLRRFRLPSPSTPRPARPVRRSGRTGSLLRRRYPVRFRRVLLTQTCRTTRSR